MDLVLKKNKFEPLYNSLKSGTMVSLTNPHSFLKWAAVKLQNGVESNLSVLSTPATSETGGETNHTLLTAD